MLSSWVPWGGAASLVRGDTNADGTFNLTDAIGTLNHLFLGAAIPCRDAADADDDGTLVVTDAVYSLNHLFLGGPAVKPPFPDCGADPTADDLECAEFAPCDGGCPGQGSEFHEGWERAALRQYVPTDLTLIGADEGDWLVGDTISSFEECGSTPQRAEVFNGGRGKALRLTSVSSDTDCSDNVWVALAAVPEANLNRGFSVPLFPDSHISFEETGNLVAPERGRGDQCLVIPCGDTIALLLTDNRGNVLAYILQRAPRAAPNERHPEYREVFLDPDAGTYSRNLFADFSGVPGFQAGGAAIVSIEFKIQEHGTAVLDDLTICRRPQ